MERSSHDPATEASGPIGTRRSFSEQSGRALDAGTLDREKVILQTAVEDEPQRHQGTKNKESEKRQAAASPRR